MQWLDRLLGRDRIWHWATPRIDLAALPTTVDLSRFRWSAFGSASVRLALIAAFLFAAVIIQFRILPSVNFLVFAVLPLLWLLPRLLSDLFATGSMFNQILATYEPAGVRVEERRLFGTNRWRLPYTDYQAVLYKERIISDKWSTNVFQIIELEHVDRRKRLPLYVEETMDSRRTRWKDYARGLRLPIVEYRPGNDFFRAVDDIDKPIRQLFAEGKLATNYNPTDPTPAGMHARKQTAGDERLTVTINRRRLSLVIYGSIFVPVLLTYLGIVSIPDTLNGKLIIGILLALGFFPPLIYWFRRGTKKDPRHIVVTRDDIAVEDKRHTDSAARGSLSLDSITDVRIVPTKNRWGREILIESANGHLLVGTGLPKGTLIWLENFLLAAIATA